MIHKIAKFMRKFGLVLAVFVFIMLSVFSIILLPAEKISGSEKNSEAVQEKILPETSTTGVPKLSEIRGPSIDGEAAATSREENATSCLPPQKNDDCQTLPPAIWIFLLVVYLFLLIFNLGTTFGKRDTVQWTWETAYTMMALGVWFWQDQCRSNLWFPLFVITLGILIYLFYLYFFDNRLGRIRKQVIKRGKQEKLDF